MVEYEKLFDSISDDKKIAFLKKVLVGSEHLQNQFVAYFAPSNLRQGKQSGSFAKRVQVYSKAFQQQLESIDLEDLDYTRWSNRGGTYVDDWEIDMELATEEIQDVFDYSGKECEQQILSGDLEAFFTTFTGVLDGCKKARINDPNETLGDPYEVLLSLFKEFSDKLEEIVPTMVLSSLEVVEAVTGVIQWFHEQNKANIPASYHDRLCSKLLQVHGENPAGLGSLFSGQEEIAQNFSRTYLTVLSKIDRPAWIQESERFAVADCQIAKELLEYQGEQKSESFYRNARVLFPIHSEELVDFLARQIEPGKDRALALQVWEYKVQNQNKLNDYEILAGLFEDVSQKKAFLKRLKASYHYEFYIEVLAHEKLFEQILDLARSPHIYLAKLKFILSYILDIYPRDCFKIALSQVEHEMQYSKLNRDTYSQIASLLSLVGNQKELNPEVRLFAKNLMVIHFRRSALREELTKVGLI